MEVASESKTTGAPRLTSRPWWFLVIAMILVASVARFVWIEADLPDWISFSAGPYVDEGYKTLSARNLVQFGETHWNEEDNYSGWHKNSPLTSWSYVAAFKLGEPNLATARAVIISYYCGFLLLFAWVMRQRYADGILALGVAFLSTCAALFFFSRLALIEVPMIFLLYGWVFYLSKVKVESYVFPLLSALVMGFVLAQGVKLSALVYFLPVIGAMFVRAIVVSGWGRSPKTYLLGGVAAVGFAVVLYFERNVWIERIDVGPLDYAVNILSSPLMNLAPFLFIIGWTCASHLLLVDFKATIQSAYRLSIVAMVLGGPLVLGFFEYNPPRYYVPLLPAFALVACEWIHFKGWKMPWFPSHRGMRAVAAFLLVVLIYSWAQVLNLFVIANLPIPSGEVPGLGEGAMLKLVLLPALAASVLLWLKFNRWLSGRVILGLLLLASVGLLVFSFARVGSFLIHPKFEGRETRNLLVESVEPQQSVIGDWAPFFALGTDVRALYMSERFNTPDRLLALRPDYFLFSDRAVSRDSIALIQKLPGVSLGTPVFESTYNNSQVLLYPLHYSVSE